MRKGEQARIVISKKCIVEYYILTLFWSVVEYYNLPIIWKKGFTDTDLFIASSPRTL